MPFDIEPEDGGGGGGNNPHDPDSVRSVVIAAALQLDLNIEAAGVCPNCTRAAIVLDLASWWLAYGKDNPNLADHALATLGAMEVCMGATHDILKEEIEKCRKTH